MRYFILPLLVALLSINGYPQQNQEPQQLFLDAEYYRLYEEYSEALPLYQRLMNEGYDNAHINYRIGECYLQSYGSKKRAIPYLKEAIKNISESFKEGSLKEDHAPVYTIFYLGKAYQINNELEKALKTYNNFLERIGDKDGYNMNFVKKQIKSCKIAKTFMEEPVPVKQENVGKKINNSFPNIKPVVNNEETRLIFTSRLKFYDAVFMSNKSDQNWEPPVNLTPQIKSDGNLYSSSINNSGNKLLLLKSNPYNGDLYLAEYNQDKDQWEEPAKLGKNINSKSWETHGCLCKNNRTIYFTSNRKGGMGGLDIYVSHYDYKNKTWGPAKNLGEKVNTPYNEETPFLTEDGKRLYYSSQGHQGMGGFDIFYVEKLENGDWSEPVNIGYPVNTTDDDLFFCPVKNGEAGYMSRYGEESYGNQDIYRIEFLHEKKMSQVELKGTIEVPEKRHNNKENILLTIQSIGDSVHKIKPDFTDYNHFTAMVKPGKYKVKIEAKGYSTIEKTVSIDENYSRKSFEVQATLQPEAVEIKDFIKVDNIYFGYDRFSLDDSSRKKLNKLAEIIKSHPDLNLEVVGHTDSKGSKEYNKKLSLKRAEAVIEYLSEKDIPKTRMSKLAKGEDFPLAINTFQDGEDCEKGRQYNRRVEIIPISSENQYVLKKSPDIPQELKKRGSV